MGRLCSLFFSLCVTLCIASSTDEMCGNLYCEDDPRGTVCGAREEGEGLSLRIFESQCDLLKFGCSVKNEKAYGIITMDYCKQAFNNTFSTDNGFPEKYFKNEAPNAINLCINYDCSYPDDAKAVCAIREDGTGFKIRLFENKCQLIKYNCEKKLNFTITHHFICDDMDFTEGIGPNKSDGRKSPNPVFLVDGSMFHFNQNINETVDNFFAATHLMNLPLENVHNSMNENSRRMLIKIFGPQVIFQPWITIPKNISEDFYHTPTLSSCFHKCPTKCPETYAPVCGVPGIVAREPSIMFQNHCFMDVAQCKMRWEDKSYTAESSSYIESSFVFCVGDQMSNMFRFLPVIRTLQHMGRLRKKGLFRYRLRNLRFLNQELQREPSLMG